MLNKFLFCFIGVMSVAFATFSMPVLSQTRDYIRIVGSSTVFPFASEVVERFGDMNDFKMPVIESTGSGGGLKLFCGGVGIAYPDITNASRRIKASEIRRCAENGVNDIIEVQIGFDGIVIANAKSAEPVSFEPKHLFLALAKNIPFNGQIIPNPHKRWRDIDPSLPVHPIEVLGPPPTSGTRDAFVEIAMENGAQQIDFMAELRKSDKKAFQRIAHTLREDGVWVNSGENDSLIVNKLLANPTAFGVFGFSFLDANTDKIQGNKVNDVAPDFERIADYSYPIARSLYFYVKKAHIDVIPGIEEYVGEFIDEKTFGTEGYLTDLGLVPTSQAQRIETRQAVKARKNLELKPKSS